MIVPSFLGVACLLVSFSHGFLAPVVPLPSTAESAFSHVLRATSDEDYVKDDDSPSDVETSDNVVEIPDNTEVVEDDFPSDVETEESPVEVPPGTQPMMERQDSEETTEQDESPVGESQVNENFLFLQTLGAITSRGEKASEEQLSAARALVSQLEAANPTPEPANNKELLQGTWQLTFTDTKHLFRSSPFFMAARAVCETKEQLEQFEWFCTMHRQALAVSQIGEVRQVISDTRLVSEFEVEAGAVPFLSDFTPFAYSGGMPVTIGGAIVSSADLTTINATAYELYMDSVQIKGSNLPGLRQVLDNGLQLESRALGDFLESNLDQYSNPRPIVRTTYLSEQFRISRDVDDHIFIYVKTSDSTTPKDYSEIESDLGIGKLVEGFNNAVTRFGL